MPHNKSDPTVQAVQEQLFGRPPTLTGVFKGPLDIALERIAELERRVEQLEAERNKKNRQERLKIMGVQT